MFDMIVVRFLSWWLVPDELSTTVVARLGTGTEPDRYQPGTGPVDGPPQGVTLGMCGYRCSGPWKLMGADPACAPGSSDARGAGSEPG